MHSSGHLSICTRHLHHRKTIHAASVTSMTNLPTKEYELSRLLRCSSISSLSNDHSVASWNDEWRRKSYAWRGGWYSIPGQTCRASHPTGKGSRKRIRSRRGNSADASACASRFARSRTGRRRRLSISPGGNYLLPSCFEGRFSCPDHWWRDWPASGSAERIPVSIYRRDSWVNAFGWHWRRIRRGWWQFAHWTCSGRRTRWRSTGRIGVQKVNHHSKPPSQHLVIRHHQQHRLVTGGSHYSSRGDVGAAKVISVAIVLQSNFNCLVVTFVVCLRAGLDVARCEFKALKSQLYPISWRRLAKMAK